MKKDSKSKQANKVEAVGKLLEEIGITGIDVEALIDLKEYSDNAGDPTLYDKFSLKKKVFISAYIKSFGIVTQAAKAAKIHRGTFYQWMSDDSDFKQYINNIDIEEVANDFNELKLMEKIASGDTAAIIYRAKNKMKHRGYIERPDITPPPKTANVHYYLPDNKRDDPDDDEDFEDIDHEDLDDEKSIN